MFSTKDWWDLSANGPTRSWPSNGVAPSPYHRGIVSPLRTIRFVGDNPNFIKTDLAHTYAIAGFGKDHLASSIVFISVRCGFWGHARFEEQLKRAFASFSQWCVDNGKYTTIREFDKTELKITSLLDFFNDCLHLSPTTTFTYNFCPLVIHHPLVACDSSGFSAILVDWGRDQMRPWSAVGLRPFWIKWMLIPFQLLGMESINIFISG